MLFVCALLCVVPHLIGRCCGLISQGNFVHVRNCLADWQVEKIDRLIASTRTFAVYGKVTIQHEHYHLTKPLLPSSSPTVTFRKASLVFSKGSFWPVLATGRLFGQHNRSADPGQNLTQQFVTSMIQSFAINSIWQQIVAIIIMITLQMCAQLLNSLHFITWRRLWIEREQTWAYRSTCRRENVRYMQTSSIQLRYR